MLLLARSNPIDGESLSSYMQRISSLNYVGSHDLWRLLKRNNSHYPQSSFSAAIDICPNNFILMDKLASILRTDQKVLENMTFLPVFQKLGINNSSANHSRIMSNIIEKQRKYCSKCLEEFPAYNLIWQVKEITFCPAHNIKLHSNCNRCKSSIPILPSNSNIGICPSCGLDFTKSNIENFTPNSEDLRIIDDWLYLLNASTLKLKLIKSFSNEQSLALRLLYISRNFMKKLSKEEQSTLSSVMQIARNTKASQTFIHLDTILHFTRKYNISLKEFFTVKVPESHIKSIFNPKHRMVGNYSCIAPWCNHYHIPGSLEKTSTSIKDLKSGKKMKYYMFCNDCGIEYGINAENNKFVERRDYISLAWNQVKNYLTKDYIFTDLSRKLNITQDRLRRSIIFLAANDLVDHSHIPIQVPSIHDPQVISFIKHCINKGITSKQIKITLGMKYNEFLFYWLSSEIRKSYLKHSKRRPDKCSSQTERIQRFESAINNLLLENIPITIERVCKELNICPETLRNWGLLQKCKTYKLTQIKKMDEKYKENIIYKAEQELAAASLNNKALSSDELYKALGVRRTVLVRKFPEVTRHIHSMLMSTNER